MQLELSLVHHPRATLTQSGLALSAVLQTLALLLAPLALLHRPRLFSMRLRPLLSCGGRAESDEVLIELSAAVEEVVGGQASLAGYLVAAAIADERMVLLLAVGAPASGVFVSGLAAVGSVVFVGLVGLGRRFEGIHLPKVRFYNGCVYNLTARIFLKASPQMLPLCFWPQSVNRSFSAINLLFRLFGFIDIHIGHI